MDDSGYRIVEEDGFIREVSQVGNRWKGRVKVPGEGGIWHQCSVSTREQADAYCRACIESKRASILKSKAAVHARRAGRIRQAVRAASGAEKA